MATFVARWSCSSTALGFGKCFALASPFACGLVPCTSSTSSLATLASKLIFPHGHQQNRIDFLFALQTTAFAVRLECLSVLSLATLASKLFEPCDHQLNAGAVPMQ